MVSGIKYGISHLRQIQSNEDKNFNVSRSGIVKYLKGKGYMLAPYQRKVFRGKKTSKRKINQTEKKELLTKEQIELMVENNKNKKK